MNKTTSVISTRPGILLFPIALLSMLTACNMRHELHCKGDVGKLHKAIFKENESKALKIAFSKKIDVHATCPEHRTPVLITAAGNGYTEVVDQLLKKGAATNDHGWRALMQAARNGHLGVIKRLLQGDIDVDINKQDKNGHTVLMDAVKAKQLCVVEFLLGQGADVNKKLSLAIQPSCSQLSIN